MQDEHLYAWRLGADKCLNKLQDMSSKGNLPASGVHGYRDLHLKMRKKLHSKFQHLVGAMTSVISSYPARATDVNLLHEFLQTVHPVATEAELIRLGSASDGGYLLPDDFEGVSACFSPGVSFNSDFEFDLAQKNIKVYMADKSVARPSKEHPLFSFVPKYIGAVSGHDFITLDEWVEGCVGKDLSDLVLAIDIEGYEYEVFLQVSASLMRRLRIIVVEFHDLESLFSEPFFKLATRAFEKILLTHTCVHIHPNNCGGGARTVRGGICIPDVMEFTFYRNDRFSKTSHNLDFPHALDSDNSPNHPFLRLPDCWHQD